MCVGVWVCVLQWFPNIQKLYRVCKFLQRRNVFLVPQYFPLQCSLYLLGSLNKYDSIKVGWAMDLITDIWTTIEATLRKSGPVLPWGVGGWGGCHCTLKNGCIFRKQTSSQPSPLFPPFSETDLRKSECYQLRCKQVTVGIQLMEQLLAFGRRKIKEELTEHF